jgi:hypothetical protein
MALLTRLDRAAEGHGANGKAIGAVADEFEQFLDLLPRGNDGAEAFLAVRFPPPDGFGQPTGPEEPEGASGVPAPLGSDQARFARLAAYERHGAALPCEVDTSDLDAAEMGAWSADQLARAAFSGFLAALPETAWPEAARAEESEANGMCKLCKLYRRYHPDGPPQEEEEDAAPEDDFEGCSIWEEDECWVTDFPPLDDTFTGWEEGDQGTPEYRRELSDWEKQVLQLDQMSEIWAREPVIKNQRRALLRYLKAESMGIDEDGKLTFDSDDEEEEEEGDEEEDSEAEAEADAEAT